MSSIQSITPSTRIVIVSMIVSCCTILVFLYYETLNVPFNSERHSHWDITQAQEAVGRVMFTLGLGGTVFVGFVWIQAKAFDLLISKTWHRNIIGAIVYFHVLLWIRLYSPANVATFLWSCVIGYYTLSVVSEGQDKLMSLLPIPLGVGLFYQSILWVLGQCRYLLESEQLAGPDVHSKMLISIVPFILSILIWWVFLRDLVIDHNVQILTRYMSDIDYFAVEHYSATTMYPLVVAVEILNWTQQKIQAEEQRRQCIERFYASSKADWAGVVQANIQETKTVAVSDVSTLLTRVQQVTADASYATRLSQARVALMSDPQFSIQLQAYNLDKHAKALRENTRATDANTTSNWVRLIFAPRRR